MDTTLQGKLVGRSIARDADNGFEASDWEPGPLLGLMLSGVDAGSLPGHDRVLLMQAHQRMISFHTARLYEAMAAVTDAVVADDGDGRVDLAWDSAALEVGTALQLTRRAAEDEIDFARRLTQRLPAVLDALRRGEIDRRRAKVIADGTDHLDDGDARAVTDAVLVDASAMTTGEVRSRIRRLCIDNDPDAARRRFDHKLTERKVVTHPTVDGTSHLMGLDLPPERVAAVTDRLTRLARDLRRTGETRTLDQLRADILLDLLEGKGLPADRRGSIDLVVDLATLTGLDDSSADLGGYGPVIADIARRVAKHPNNLQRRYTVTHPDTGHILDTGITNRRPTASTRRAVEARHRRCVFPGCRMPATRCDLDHEVPWSEGGPTCPCHLLPLCRHHHTHRHHRWTYHQLDNGLIEWTSPLGHTYTTNPHPP